MKLKTPRLTLVPLGPEHRDAWIAFHEGHEDHWKRWTPQGPRGKTYGEWFDEVCTHATTSWAAGTNYRFAGMLPDNTIATLVGLNNVVRRVFQNADMGWRVRSDLEGQGYTLETMTALIAAAFRPEGPDGFGLHRVQAAVMPANTRSIALAKRLGMRQEGYALRMVQIAGNWEDHLIFAKLVDEHAPTAPPS